MNNNNKLKEYVLGFAFSERKKEILLIRKNRPEFQAGRLNGIGGKIENFELPIDAMVREFKEEANLDTNRETWKLFCKLSGEKELIYCYKSFIDISQYSTMTDEIIIPKEVDKIVLGATLEDELMPNLAWLTQMALSPSTVESKIYNVYYQEWS